jgi:N-acetylglucosamine kinase-like BadF-type ATPase
VFQRSCEYVTLPKLQEHFMAYFAGIDGGGSQTTCVVGDEEYVLGRAECGTAKIARVGELQAKLTLLRVLQEGCSTAGISPEQLDSICVGMSGAGNVEVADTIRGFFVSLRAKVDAVPDIVIAAEAALGEGAGIVVIAGTGSIAHGRNQRGETARAGGWGPEISDEGSGSWIGRRAVGAALRAYDSGKHSALLAAVLDAYRITGVSELVRFLNLQPAPDYAQLVPVLLQLANDGDEFALRILSDAGAELAELGVLVLRKLWPDAEHVKVFTSGGIFRHSHVTRDTFATCLHRQFPSAEISKIVVDPALGALALARKVVVAAGKSS